jgi:tRNA(Ile)-lysidine synthase
MSLSSLPARETGIVQRVRASLARSLPPSRPHILVGFSGGQDSLALTLVLTALARAGALTVESVHVDHDIRATSGDAAAGVRSIGDALRITTHVVTLDPNAIASHAGVGEEEALRRERYLAFARVARERDAYAVALAHHQRDQAETVLLHLMRGAGLSGASGMREWCELVVPWWSSADGAPTPLRIWRPFLSERYLDVALLSEESGFEIHEDETNEERRYRRNAVRHDVLPLLESISAGATVNLARFGDLALEDDHVLDRIAVEAMGTGDMVLHGDLDRRALADLPRAIQRRILRRWIAASGYDGELTANRIDAVIDVASRNRSGASVEIGAGWYVQSQSGALRLHRR